MTSSSDNHDPDKEVSLTKYLSKVKTMTKKTAKNVQNCLKVSRHNQIASWKIAISCLYNNVAVLSQLTTSPELSSLWEIEDLIAFLE